ncbi:OmpA family protein [Aliivibrio fischeri]|uniref:OmpA family protein n=1 Tax=Aliivibrio fischeri TaxID=668 RepID=A0A844NX63_ALIFS|nr:OmpA family protein [Aliivibrio fischeri]MUK36329.1 OmpA family protein [Aliivibrio fischeri]MUK47759.1 OmpA family protein [Aliivibrio fischeri]MUL05348.1 OmpA family protein [Aliivibrio fischeri]
MKKICVLLALFSANVLSAEQNHNQEFNQLLDYYCGTEKVEFQEQVTIGEGKQILFHQGPFMQVNAELSPDVIKRTFGNAMQQANLSNQCNEYLLSYAEVVEDNVEQKLFARVLFNFDQYSLTERSKYILQNVTEKLETQKDTVLLNGHTDNKGRDNYNINLGLARSNSVKAFLLDQGASKEQLESYSFGEQQPIDDNTTLEGQHHNRRVDIEKKADETN